LEYFKTEHGKEKRREAQKKFESTEARKEYQREWQKQRRLKLKEKKLNSEDSDQ
jgi:hypothetical protein